MSRGLGAVQRRILEQLRHNTVDPIEEDRNYSQSVREMAAAFARVSPADWGTGVGVGCDIDTYRASYTTVLELAGDNATRSQIESTRRAVLKLKAAGLVDVEHVSRPRPYRRREYGAWRKTVNGRVYWDPHMPYVATGTADIWMLAARLNVEAVSPSQPPQHLLDDESN